MSLHPAYSHFREDTAPTHSDWLLDPAFIDPPTGDEWADILKSVVALPQ